ncbi:MAG: hypothetical protein AAFO06_11015 [Cyanobacteria bacterium J06597_16]
MKKLTFIGIFLSIVAIAPPSFSQSLNTAKRSSQATVALYRGQGVTLNFRPTGETVQRAWLDDPSQTTLDFDDASCRSPESESCAASVIHLRRINPIDFPGLPAVDITNLTVVTNAGLYSFQLTFPETGSPSYSVLDIQPERDPLSVASSALSLASLTEEIAAIERGLRESVARGLLSKNDPLWERTQTFLALMRDGTLAEEAARQAGVSQALIIQLAQMGQPSPNIAI